MAQLADCDLAWLACPEAGSGPRHTGLKIQGYSHGIVGTTVLD